MRESRKQLAKTYTTFIQSYLCFCISNILKGHKVKIIYSHNIWAVEFRYFSVYLNFLRFLQWTYYFFQPKGQEKYSIIQPRSLGTNVQGCTLFRVIFLSPLNICVKKVLTASSRTCVPAHVRFPCVRPPHLSMNLELKAAPSALVSGQSLAYKLVLQKN